MKVLLTRDSVAMGDDVDAPHEQQRTFPDELALREVVGAIVDGGYLARIAGGRATWVLRAGDAAAVDAVAVVAQQWREPRLLTDGQQPIRSFAGPDGTVRLHFGYLAQQDPEAVLAGLV